MFAHRNTWNWNIGQLLKMPGLVVFMFLPISLPMIVELSLPVSDNTHAFIMLLIFILFFITIIWQLIKQLRHRS